MLNQNERGGHAERPFAAGHGPVALMGQPEECTRSMYPRVLEQAGYEVVMLPNESAAAATVGASVIILLFADAAASGLHLVRELRTQADTRSTPLIALTRFDDAYLREQIVRAGATAIFIEPVKPPLLLRQLRRLLARTVIAAGTAAPRTGKLTVTPAP